MAISLKKYRGAKVKNKFMYIVAICLCVCFMFAGCNLLDTNNAKDYGSAAVLNNGSVLLTKQDIKTAYDTYFESYYKSYSENAFDKLVDDLITERLLLNEAKALIEKGDIKLSNTEKNYLYDQTFKAIINNLETFEKEAKKLLNIKVDKEEEKETNSQYVYTEYTPQGEVYFDSETNKYEVRIGIRYLIKNADGEYKYVSSDEYASYTEPEKLIGYSDFKYENLESTDREVSAVAQEAKRLYIAKLLKNEEGKGLSTDNDSVFEREFNRIYDIVYKNFVTSKLYQHKTQGINITANDVLKAYTAKVKETYERYQENSDSYKKEITTSVISANLYGQYSSSSNSIEDVFYIPKYDENFFMVYHIIVQYTDEQVKKINDAKQKLDNGAITQAEFDAVIKEEQSKIRLAERDEEGTIIVKSTDENALTFDQMLENLKTDMAEASTPEEKADVFNKYMYKYGTDTGSLQIQKDYFGGTHENWYGYIVGSKDTDNNFLEEFVKQARALYNNDEGIKGSISDKFYMESWKEETKKDADGETVKDEEGNEVKVKTFVYGGYDVMMYAGKVSNLFECFDNEKFELSDLPENAIYVLSQKRLGLCGNKTLFDLVFEDVHQGNYDLLVKDLKDDVHKNAKIQKLERVYSSLNPFA